MSSGFLGRWSQRKREALAGRLADDPPEALASGAPVQPAGASSAMPLEGSDPALEAPSRHADALDADAVLPTLADAEQLTPASDFQPFMSKRIAPEIRNAAMKKLFTDPHFNVMDGLDIYIGDYNTPDPLPPEMLRQMVGAQFLSLWDDEVVSGELAPAAVTATPLVDPLTEIPTDAANAAANPSEHDHTDLRLQPNPAAASSKPESGAG